MRIFENIYLTISILKTINLSFPIIFFEIRLLGVWAQKPISKFCDAVALTRSQRISFFREPLYLMLKTLVYTQPCFFITSQSFHHCSSNHLYIYLFARLPPSHTHPPGELKHSKTKTFTILRRRQSRTRLCPRPLGGEFRIKRKENDRMIVFGQERIDIVKYCL